MVPTFSCGRRMNTSSDVTEALAALTRGNGHAAAELLPLVYDELRRLAERYLGNEPPGQTLQPTALVHDVYLRLVGRDDRTWENRAQFFAVAAQAMRRMLIDHARRRRSAKRGGNRRKLSLDDVTEPSADRDAYLVALDDALTELALIDRQLSRVIELRFFGGLTVQETARVMEVAPVTVKRMWKLAKGWLHREVTKGSVR